jgi:hypothetical protein
LPDDRDVQSPGLRLVLGAASWSIYDVRLLVRVSEAVASGAHPDIHVAVFDVDQIGSSAEFQRLFPGIGEVFHTPVVGLWEDGELKEVGSGFAARQIVGRLLGFDPAHGLEITPSTPD